MRFKRVYIEITNCCNLSCSFCIHNHRKEMVMSVDAFHHVLKEVNDYTDYIYLHVLGEPLLHPQLDEILSLCDEYNKKVIITTNATLLKKRLNALLHPCLQTINVSLHSYYEHRMDDYVENIFECAKILAEHQIHVNYRFWQLQDGSLNAEMESLLSKVLTYYDVETPASYRNLMRMNLASYIHLHFDALFEWPSLGHAFVSDRGRCYGLKSMCGVLVDGSVVPCCLDSKGDVTLGNIFNETMEQIMQGERYLTMYKGLQNQKLVEPLCQRCGYRRRFD